MKQEGNCTYNVILRRVLATIVVLEKYWVLQNLCVYICSLRYQACNAHAPYFYCGLPSCTLFYTLSHKQHDFRKKIITEHKMCLIFSTMFIRNIFYCKKNWTRYDRKCILVFMYSTVPVILVRFAWNLNFLNRFSKNPKMSNFMHNRQVGAELCGRRDGRTDERKDERKDGQMTKLIVAFRNFANAPKNTPLKFEVIRYSLSCVVTFFTASRQIRTASSHVVFNSFTHRPPVWSHYAELRMSSYKTVCDYIYI